MKPKMPLNVIIRYIAPENLISRYIYCFTNQKYITPIIDHNSLQIRVRIIEAKALNGTKSLRPLCKVTIMNQHRQTKWKKSTNQPWFNEIFFFNIYESPSKLMEESLQLDVSNSKKYCG